VGAPGQTAVGALQRAGFRPYVVHEYSRTVHAGNVIATTPASTQSLQPGKRVTVVVSNGAPATVPSLGELSLSESEQRIIAAGLTVLTYHGPRTAKGWTTEPPAGTVVPEGSSVTLYAKH
jgi:beta-lactam-binding protein with PASTA domain